MKKLVSILFLGIVLYGCGLTKGLVSADKTPIVAYIDLVNVVDDKVTVTLDPGAFTMETVSFYIPKTVPGTYSTDNYGKYIENFKAYNYKGDELTVSKTGDNTWNISDGKKLDKVTYRVNDTYDTEYEVEEPVFSPAGTNILKGETFMLNLHGFIGYFKGLKEVPYTLNISTPKELKASTSLTKKKEEEENLDIDTFYANRYFEVIDNPILYAKSNTETFQINDITVTLSVYSPTAVYTATMLKDRMEQMMKAQKAFLGEINGTKRYSILLHLSTLEKTDAKGFGALEHHTSTVVVLPESMPKQNLEQTMVDVVSHEFFHTVTPLNVHSKEVQYFDFNDPKMSAHLWMYEGTTEYFANLFQIQQGLIDETEFYKRIIDKINGSKRYDDTMSFTEMSKKILEEPYKDNYANVYEKGALINMVLDIKLRELSKGGKSILWLMKELSKKYGNDVPFEDDDIIDEIILMTYPEIRTIFDANIIGNTPIAYEYYLAKVGLKIVKVEEPSGFFLNGEIPYIDVDQTNNNAIFIRENIALNSFFTDLGAQGGDVIKSINKTPINLETIRTVIGQSFSWSPDKEITMVVQRGEKEVTIKGKAGMPMVMSEKIVPMEEATKEQLELRKLWIKA